LWCHRERRWQGIVRVAQAFRSLRSPRAAVAERRAADPQSSALDQEIERRAFWYNIKARNSAGDAASPTKFLATRAFLRY
jgi:hypothetical protein